MKKHVFLVLTLCCLLWGCGEREAAPRAKPVSAPVPLTVASWDEAQEHIAAQKGKVVVLDLWSTWCQPCLEEFPNLVKLHKAHGGEVVCLSFNLNYSGAAGEKPDDARGDVFKFLTNEHATFQNFLSRDPDEQVYKRLDLAAVPAVLVFDRQGKLRKRFDNDANEYGDEGFSYERHIVPLVEELLAEK